MTVTYSKEEVQNSTLEYFGGDPLASDVFMKYALRDIQGNILEKNPDEMHRRMAREFARIESKYPNPMSEDEIYQLFKNFEKVVPQGSPMSGIGNNHQLQSLSNCFVIQSPEDSYGGILFSDQEQVQIMKRRGGVGFDISTIRPKGMITSNAAKTTDGIGVFMERFSNSCREVAQGGRRGALMLTIHCNHPELETFINIKRDLKKVTGANISIRFTDEFMNAVENDLEFVQRWPIHSSVKDALVTKTVKAKEIWNQFVDSAWASAEPGALFWDTVERNSPADCYEDYKSISTNPCGEIVLSPYDSCRLMVVNLTSFVKDPFTSSSSFDFEDFYQTVFKAQRLMDDLIDLELESIDKIITKIKEDQQPENVKQIELDLWRKIEGAARRGRRTGLGITGLGDCLAALNIRYGSDESVKMTEEIYRYLGIGAHASSLIMAKERGSFPEFDFSKEEKHEYLRKMITSIPSEKIENAEHLWMTSGRRNIALTTTAPVGSVSCLTQTTSGIEPAFLLSYKRRRKITEGDFESKVDFVDELGDRWQEYTVYHHWFKKWMDTTGLEDEKLSPYFGGTANDIDWIKSVDIQAAAQQSIDHSISKTCNLPNSATKELVSDVYMRAWKTGCKGFTVYRDGCRNGVLVSTEEKKETKPVKSAPNRMSPERPKEISCDIHHAKIKDVDGQYRNWLVIVGLLEGKPYEVFCGVRENIEIPRKYKQGMLIKNGKKEGVSTYNLIVPVGDEENLVFKDIMNIFDNPTQGAFTRTISLALRHGVPVQYVVEQLQKDKHSDMFSFSKIIARVLKGYIQNGSKAAGEKSCPSCGSHDLIYQEGCITCASCGWSKCS